MDVVGFFASWQAVHTWLVVGGALVVAEMFIPGFVIGSFGIGAFVAALMAWLGVELNGQLAICAVVGAALVMPARWMFRHLMRGAPDLQSGADAMAGRKGVVLDRIEGDLTPGRVRVNGSTWSARTAAGVVLEPEAVVRIERVEGVKLVVVPLATPAVGDEVPGEAS